MTSITDASGRETQVGYDSQGRQVSRMDPFGIEVRATYDANGNPVTKTATVSTPAGPRTLVTTTSFDKEGRVISSTNPMGEITQIRYDASGNRIATIDALDRATQYRYDHLGRLVETIFPDGTSELSEYDAAGRRVATTDRAKRVTRYEYDRVDRVLATIFPDATPNNPNDNPRARTEYNLAGQVIARIDPLGNRTEFEYDTAGRQILMRNAQGQETRQDYDAAGRLIATTDALGNTTRFGLDSLGKTIQTHFADGTTISRAYDFDGNVTEEVDQAGRVTRYEYDRVGRLAAVIDAMNSRTEYTYDEFGQLIERKDALGRATAFEYDDAGRQVAAILPLGQRATTTYDAVGNVLSTTDYNGTTTEFEYDAVNRVRAARFSDGMSFTFTYTPGGRRESIIDARGVTAYTYDELDRLLSRTDPDGTQILYTYDAAGNQTSVTTPAGLTSYSFDSLNRLATVTNQGGITRYEYDAVGNLVRTELPNNVVETRSYDDLYRLVSLESRGDSGILARFLYTVDGVGNRTDIIEGTGRQVHYTYDELSRLVGETITEPLGGIRTIDYSYDTVGNRIARDDSDEGLTQYAYDANDRLLSETRSGQTTQYTYDNNGNPLTRVSGPSDQTTYRWDARKRMVAADVTDGGGTRHLEYDYDANGVRVASRVDGQETRYLLDANRKLAQVLLEYRPGGAIEVSYTYGLDLISQQRAGVQSFYHVDGLGSTRVLTDAGGTVTDRYAFDAFGRLISRSGGTLNSYLFTGEQRDAALGLDYLRARYLDVGAGRFFGRDAFKGSLNVPATMHPYLYARMNPANWTDPSGNQTMAKVSASLTIIGILSLISHSTLPLLYGGLTGDVPDMVSFGLFGAGSLTADALNSILATVSFGLVPGLFGGAVVGLDVTLAPRLKKIGVSVWLAGESVFGAADQHKFHGEVGGYEAWYWNRHALEEQGGILPILAAKGAFLGFEKNGDSYEFISGISSDTDAAVEILISTPLQKTWEFDVSLEGMQGIASILQLALDSATVVRFPLAQSGWGTVGAISAVIINTGAIEYWLDKTYGKPADH
jgi:RHS repeat-associated protein